jgi:diguanylate cyclase (GGDEF)-like protein
VPAQDPILPLPGDDDPHARERERVMYALSLLFVAALLPFAVHNLIKGRLLLAATVSGVVLPVALDAWAIRARRRPPIPYALLLVPIAIAVVASLATQGVIGAFWCYPAVVFFFFVLRRRTANACSIALLLIATAMVYRTLGTRVTVRFAASLVLTIAVINVFQNIIGELQRRLLAQAITDPLTGAYNRRYMEARLEEALQGARRRPEPVSLLMVDVDHFKRVNDEHGHKAGDGVLRGLVQLLRHRARAVDLLFRMGGEEFVLLLPDTPEDAAAGVAEELRQAIAATALLDGKVVTASLGVAGARPEDTVESWLRAADAAMYAAKEAGRNRVARRA